MSARTLSKRPRRKKSRTGTLPVDAASTMSMAAQNLLNMSVVFAVSGTVLLGLLAARHF
jgi:hypothetical protein